MLIKLTEDGINHMAQYRKERNLFPFILDETYEAKDAGYWGYQIIGFTNHFGEPLLIPEELILMILPS